MSAASDREDQGRYLQVAYRRVQHEDAGGERVLAVFCPRKGRAIDLRDCRRCDDFKGLCIDETDRDTFLRCSCADIDVAQMAEAPESHVQSHSAGAARETALRQIMTAPARSVTPELSIAALTAVFLDTGLNAAPVVDGNGRAIGIVSKTDVLREYFMRDANSTTFVRDTPEPDTLEIGPALDVERVARATVRDVMGHVVFSLPEDASIIQAAALMSYEGVHRIVVTGPDGAAIGIASSLDILRWLARGEGYIVPDLTRIQTEPPPPGF